MSCSRACPKDYVIDASNVKMHNRIHSTFNNGRVHPSIENPHVDEMYIVLWVHTQHYILLSELFCHYLSLYVNIPVTVFAIS